MAVLGLCALFGKVCADLWLPGAGMSSGLDLGVVMVPEAHLVGGVVGTLLGAMAPSVSCAPRTGRPAEDSP